MTLALRVRHAAIGLLAMALTLRAMTAACAEHRTSELMPVDFMSAVEDKGPIGNVTPIAAALAQPPANDLRMPLQTAPEPIDVPPPVPSRQPIVFPIITPSWFSSPTCPNCQQWTRGYMGSNYGMICTCNDRNINGVTLNAYLRGYYLNDQRIEWSGCESTLGAEGVVIPRIIHNVGDWTIAGNGVFFINQPFDQNILVTPERQSYAADFQVPPFQIWNMNLSLTRGDFHMSVGKDNTPFGRYYFPLYTNSRMDAPFIRTEAIGFVETGVFFRYTPGIFSFDVALTNGGADRDTNSSKDFVGRFGINTGNFICGVSAKVGDGVGSDGQKEANNVFGGDFMYRRGQFDISGEVIYNQYGFRHPFDPSQIFWGRDLYYRDTYSGTPGGSLQGTGYYVNVGRTWPRFRGDLNYGTFFPSPIGNPLVDTPTTRGFAKATFVIMRHLETYGMILLENARPTETFRQGQKPIAVLSGFQTYF
jgi:hypothetical protein